MANNFGDLVTAVQVNLDTVLREQIGYIPAVWMNATAAEAAYGQTIQYPIAPVMVAEDASADCCDVPCAGDQTWGVGSMVINHNRRVMLCWTGEEDKAIGNSFNQSGASMRDLQIQQGIRTLVNEIESSIAAEMYNASQVYVPVNGGVLFNQPSDNLEDLTLIRKELIDNATPDSDLHLVMNTLAGAKIRNLPGFTRANENNSDVTLRRGKLLDAMGFGLHESFAAGIPRTAGTGTGYLVVGAQTAGDNTIPVDTGTGTILPGDRLTFAGNTDTYTVISYSGGIITLNRGLTGSLADNAAVTLGSGAGPQAAFKREAVVLATRAPAILGGNDRARDRAYITDPYSGMTFMLSQYDGYRATNFELSIVWGVKMVKPEMAVYIPG